MALGGKDGSGVYVLSRVLANLVHFQQCKCAFLADIAQHVYAEQHQNCCKNALNRPMQPFLPHFQNFFESVEVDLLLEHHALPR